MTDTFDYDFRDTSQIDYKLTVCTKINNKMFKLVLDHAKKDFLKKNPQIYADVKDVKMPERIPLPEGMKKYTYNIMNKVCRTISDELKGDGITLLTLILQDGSFVKKGSSIMFELNYCGMYKSA